MKWRSPAKRVSETEEVPLSSATYGAPLKTCRRDDCCQLPTGGNKAATEVDVLGGKYSFPQFNFKSYEPHTEIIYPPALRKYTKQPIFYGNEKKVWFRPTAIELFVELKHVYPSAKIVAGSSEVQVEVKFKHEKYGVSGYVGDIEGLKGFSVDEEKRQVVIGGNTSLTVPEMACLEGYKKLVRDSWRVSVADEEYFVAYKATAIPADAIITKLTIPLPAEGTREVIKFYKEAKRGDDDIAIVTAGLRVVLDESSVVTDISLAHGGSRGGNGKVTLTLPSYISRWANYPKDLPLGFTVPGGMPTYRKTLVCSVFFRLWHEVAAELELGTQVQQVDHEVIEEIHRGISYGSRGNDNPYEQRATGEAEYIDDMPSIEGQLFGGLVLSKKAYAKLVQVDFTPALQVPDVIGVVDVKDLDDERNLWGRLRKASHSLRRTLCTRMEYCLETIAAAVIPRPDDEEMEVWSSTQNIMETQEFVLQVTGAPSSRIVAKVKRMGGGFGGKEKGMLKVLDADIYNNAGYSQDLNDAVMDRALTHMDSCY
ncbi:hypothetical protein L873DRAFT_1794487 [Choiromyces venosus 120613-1]|uniref:FAD-binding PCMH-type domain-containing protein n=1 Tax=Choiromyces venosus 120613-1 TaxID=1336337 RepID=A0A3N4JE71_9PEZI|nr:hypothetical protein L873DRAFT_1794487 [Choiromyces venosus 120613-1]